MWYLVYISKSQSSKRCDIKQSVTWEVLFCIISYIVDLVGICFFSFLHTVMVCFVYDCRVAFLPMLTLTATAWAPTIFRYLWTVPLVLKWPTTSVTGPCACLIRVGLRHLAQGRGAAGQRVGKQASGSQSGPKGLSALGRCSTGAAANCIFLPSNEGLNCLRILHAFIYFSMFYWEFPPLILLAVLWSWKAGSKIFHTACGGVASNLGVGF